MRFLNRLTALHRSFRQPASRQQFREPTTGNRHRLAIQNHRGVNAPLTLLGPAVCGARLATPGASFKTSRPTAADHPAFTVAMDCPSPPRPKRPRIITSPSCIVFPSMVFVRTNAAFSPFLARDTDAKCAHCDL
ncbi:hypothetical protein EVAR_69986_1 [Eumeta japonica]|uniref:Uncharacterized protein n=1 Tax=Eumeta variegata TaxID=151549 RepID=A0A4C1ZGS2_EUMVA|nr:hypothetical protein EVAR_69986_1 [Eumeta japonica]